MARTKSQSRKNVRTGGPTPNAPRPTLGRKTTALKVVNKSMSKVKKPVTEARKHVSMAPPKTVKKPPPPAPAAKPHKRPAKRGTVALREIKIYQKSVDLLIPKLAFSRVCREITGNLSENVTHWTKEAMLSLQEAAEGYMVDVLDDANVCAIHAKRVTIMPKDVQLSLRLRDDKVSK